MKICPKCGWPEYHNKCRACGEKLDGIEESEKNDDDYIGKLTDWIKDKPNFLNAWRSKQDDRYFSYRRDIDEIEIAAENNFKIEKALKDFNEIVFGEFKDAESCITAYLSEEKEDAVKKDKAREKLEKFVADETEKRTPTSDVRYRNVFAYYVNLVKCISNKYKESRNYDETKKCAKELYGCVISNVNELCKMIFTQKILDMKYRKNSKFRVYKSDFYPDIHDDYVEYLKVLVSAVKRLNDQTIKTTILSGVIY